MTNVDSKLNREGQTSSRLAKIETLSLLYVAVFLTRIGFGTILIIFPNKNFLDVSPAVLGVVLALYPAIEGTSALPIGAYVDRRGRRRAFVFGMALISVLTLILGLTNNLLVISSVHAVMGLSAAMVTIASLTMITDLTVEKNRGAGMGTFNLANLGGYGVGILLGTFFSGIFAYRLGDTFLVVAGLFAAATAFIFFSLREPPHDALVRKSIREMYNILVRNVAVIFPIWFAITVIIGLYLFLPRLVSNENVFISNSAGIIALGLLVLGAGSTFFGRLSDKIGRPRMILLGVAGEIGFLLILPDLFQKLIVIPTSQPWLMSIQQLGPIGIVGGILFFLGSALIPSILAYFGDKAANEFRGSAMGLYSLLLSLGLALGAVLAGVADEVGSAYGGAQAGVQAVFYTGAVILGGLSLTTGLLMRRNRLTPSSIDQSREQSKPI